MVMVYFGLSFKPNQLWNDNDLLMIIEISNYEGIHGCIKKKNVTSTPLWQWAYRTIGSRDVFSKGWKPCALTRFSYYWRPKIWHSWSPLSAVPSKIFRPFSGTTNTFLINTSKQSNAPPDKRRNGTN